MSFLILMALLLVVFYVLMIRPQRRRQQEHQSMIDGAGVGEDILTTGGIYGTLVRAEGDDIVVEIADGVNVHMTRRGIAAVLPPEGDEEDEAVDDDVIDADPDDAPVTDDDDVVRSEADADVKAAERS